MTSNRTIHLIALIIGLTVWLGQYIIPPSIFGTVLSMCGGLLVGWNIYGAFRRET